MERENEILLAVVLNEKNGKEYVIPNEIEFYAIESAKKKLIEKLEIIKNDLIPLEEMPDDNRGGHLG